MNTVASPKTYVRAHVRSRPLRGTPLTSTVLITMDNGKEFAKLTAQSPAVVAPLEAFQLPGGMTVGQWLAYHPSYHILSYRAVRGE